MQRSIKVEVNKVEANSGRGQFNSGRGPFNSDRGPFNSSRGSTQVGVKLNSRIDKLLFDLKLGD